MAENKSNPVVEIYRDRAVRRYNTIRIRVSQFEFKKFIDAKIDFNCSERQAIEKKMLLCPCKEDIISPAKSQYASHE
jgi:hypothetical protein